MSEQPHFPYSISVVIPVYNGSRTVPELVSRLNQTLTGLVERVEIILVNDGSPDASWERIQEIAGAAPNVRGINLMRNYGQHNALLCGIRLATGEVVIAMDDDLEHPPSEIPKLLTEIDKGYDLVYGRPLAEQHGLWRDVASRVTKIALASAMGAETAANVSSFKAFRTELRAAFDTYRGPFVSVDVLLTWATRRVSSLKVRHDPRRVGDSNYTFRRLVVHALNMITGFTVAPLRIASIIGFFFAAFGIALLAHVVISSFTKGSGTPGFVFLVSIISIFSGAQMFALGIIGEYLARIYARSMDRPPYAIRETTPNVGRPASA
jgi:undecaprenyl-phosphate 4-deoxy-4-formamido-L-arabinose transferase